MIGTVEEILVTMLICLALFGVILLILLDVGNDILNHWRKR